ncbi:hypothetical protein [Bacteriovorax sp. Seq25_V]|uniref:hypothetical protein n=1 Tax=Bacteriovorax sp. Seq25_V TaxID=1201288 RepID=UPI00038A1DA0|nr:hypothetical protein [Bacteriovorax sp. Seq25_V]EQC44205.1 hypothetical protein M900_A0269 [Bacteriovorax sp. Seq25_V]
MKKFITLATIILVFTTQSVRAEMDPKIKAIGTMALYGTVGGTLLGTASLAFGAKGRSVAIGASLGLYAGLLFGGYVVGTHALKSRGYQKADPENYYPDTESSPYETPGPGSNNEYMNPDNYEGSLDLAPLKKQEQGPVYFVQLLDYRF